MAGVTGAAAVRALPGPSVRLPAAAGAPELQMRDTVRPVHPKELVNLPYATSFDARNRPYMSRKQARQLVKRFKQSGRTPPANGLGNRPVITCDHRRFLPPAGGLGQSPEAFLDRAVCDERHPVLPFRCTRDPGHDDDCAAHLGPDVQVARWSRPGVGS